MLALQAAVLRPPEDHVLVARARRGDVAAFEKLLARHDATMRGLAFRTLGSATAMDDVLQDAYLRAFRSLARFAGESQFATWLYRIVANACIDELRRAARRPAVALDEVGERPDPSPDLAEHAAERADLAAALAALPPELRLVVLMVDAKGFSYDEVAEVLGVPVGTVGSRLSRARAALRPHLAEAAKGGSPR